jgi:alkylation response protein AidB-like acyl-CoA dehydrogenase
LDASVAYTKERKQFRRPVSDFQGVQFMLADMVMKVKAARVMARRQDHPDLRGHQSDSARRHGAVFAGLTPHFAERAFSARRGVGPARRISIVLLASAIVCHQ